MEPSDEALVLACRRGDAAAWEALVMRYQRLIYSVLRRAGLDEDQAADAFQHLFLTLLEQLDRIEQPARIRAWLVTTARREAWGVRRRDRAPVLAAGRSSVATNSAESAPDPLDGLPDGDPLPDAVLLRLEEQHAVRLGVAALGGRCRELLTLLYYRPDPPSYAEIAAAFGTSEGSIGPTRARCLQKLQRLLTESGF